MPGQFLVKMTPNRAFEFELDVGHPVAGFD
jgi:hypothetical protein